MGKSGPATPPPRDYYKETMDTLTAQVRMAPSLYAAEAAYSPKMERLALGGYRNTLLGRVSYDELSETSKSEYNVAKAEYDQAPSKISALDSQIARTRGGARAELERERDRLKLVSQAPPDPAAFSDRGLMQILENDIMPSMARTERSLNTAQRTQDIADVENLGQRASEAYLNADPRSKSLIEGLNRQAMEGLNANGALTDSQRRYAEQTARSGIATRGLGLSAQGVAADVLGTYQLSEARRTAAMTNAGAVLGYNKQFTADPFQAILGRQGQAFQAGNNQQQFASGFANNIGPKTFSPESQYAADMQNSNQQTAASYAAARAQVQSATIGAIGSAIGNVAGGAAQGAAIAACWVAREIYGVDNPKWVIFRGWMLNESPEWFRSIYLKHGEKFAKYIKDKPLLKAIIQKGMDTIVYPRMILIYA